MGLIEIVLLIVLPLSFWIAVLTFRKFKILTGKKKISANTRFFVYYITIVCPILGYCIVSKMNS